MNKQELGRYLENLAKESGFDSKGEFARKTGITTATVSRVFNGLQYPSTKTLKAFAEHLKGITYEELLQAAGILDEEKEQGREVFAPGEKEDLLELLKRAKEGRLFIGGKRASEEKHLEMIELLEKWMNE